MKTKQHKRNTRTRGRVYTSPVAWLGPGHEYFLNNRLFLCAYGANHFGANNAQRVQVKVTRQKRSGFKPVWFLVNSYGEVCWGLSAGCVFKCIYDQLEVTLRRFFNLTTSYKVRKGYVRVVPCKES